MKYNFPFDIYIIDIIINIPVNIVVVGNRYFSDSSNDKKNQDTSETNGTKEASTDNQQSDSNNNTTNNPEIINYAEINQKLVLEIKELKEKVTT